MSDKEMHTRVRSRPTRLHSVLSAMFIASSLAFAPRSTAQPPNMRVIARDWKGLVRYDDAYPPVKKDPKLNPVFWIPLAGGRDSIPDGSLGYFRHRYSYEGVVIDRGLMKYSYYKANPFPIGGDSIGVNVSLYAGSPVYEAQEPLKRGERRPTPYNDYCAKAHLDKLRDDVLEHEGARSSTSWKSHFWEYVVYFRTHDIGTMEERVAFRVDPNSSASNHLQNRFDSTFAQAGLAAAESANVKIVHAPSNLIPALPCKLRRPTS